MATFFAEKGILCFTGIHYFWIFVCFVCRKKNPGCNCSRDFIVPCEMRVNRKDQFISICHRQSVWSQEAVASGTVSMFTLTAL